MWFLTHAHFLPNAALGYEGRQIPNRSVRPRRRQRRDPLIAKRDALFEAAVAARWATTRSGPRLAR